MKKVFFLILSLSIPQAYASEKYSNKHADIVYASDNELIYKSTDSESSRLWHYDVTNSSGVPIDIAKPYLKNSLLSYKKIDDLEIYTIEGAEQNTCDTWIHYQENNKLVASNTLCDTDIISLSNNRLYVALPSSLPVTPDEWQSSSLVSYDLQSNETHVELDRADLATLDSFSTYSITDIKHYATNTFVKLTDESRDYTWVIKLSNNREDRPAIIFEGIDGDESRIEIFAANELYIATSVGYSRSTTSLYKWVESTNFLEKIFSQDQSNYEFTSFLTFKNNLLSLSSQEGLNTLNLISASGDVTNLTELEGNVQGIYSNGEALFYTNSDSPFGKVYKISESYSNELLFQLTSYDRSLVIADSLIYFFSNEGIHFYNQEEKSSTLLELPTHIEAPQISGEPASTVKLNQDYRFTPDIFDSLNIPLKLTISNKPDWATFDANTGTLSGKPLEISKYENIVITASNGYMEQSLPAFSINVVNAEPEEEEKSSGGSLLYLISILGVTSLVRKLKK